MIITDPSAADTAVLGYLNERGPGPVTITRIAAATGLPRVTVRTSVVMLMDRGAVCLRTDFADYGMTTYVIMHLHPDKLGDDADGPVAG
jgi:DNA-binding IclR family transcriptional regulator